MVRDVNVSEAMAFAFSHVPPGQLTEVTSTLGSAIHSLIHPSSSGGEEPPTEGSGMGSVVLDLMVMWIRHWPLDANTALSALDQCKWLDEC